MDITGNAIKLIQWLYNQDKNKIFQIKEYKAIRNKDQNAKYWKLVNELALTLKLSKEELHFKLLKDYSVRYEVMVPAEYELRGVEYYERKSKIIKNGQEFIIYHIFVPSHELKENEFALLLEGLIEECKLQGIETRSPEEITRDERLLNNYNRG